jgi:hypothetical protein
MNQCIMIILLRYYQPNMTLELHLRKFFCFFKMLRKNKTFQQQTDK